MFSSIPRVFAVVVGASTLFVASASADPAAALADPAAASTQQALAPAVSAEPAACAADDPAPCQKASGRRVGVYAELDLGMLVALRQSAGFAGGAVWGPFRAGLSYATFLSNSTFGGTPDGFTMRANYIVGINAAYFIGQKTDQGAYIQAMLHIKQQGVTNNGTGDHRDLNSLAAGFELGYVWKLYRGMYVAPRVGALYYVKKPQGANNEPVQIGDKMYDNDRHKRFDTYFIPTLSLGYSW